MQTVGRRAPYRVQETRYGREPHGYGRGGGDYDLRDVRGPPQGTRPDVPFRVYGHLHEGAVTVGLAVDGDV